MFSQLGLAEPCLRALQSEGYDKATRVLIGLAGRDLLGIAQTGTGKTAIFAVPDIRRRVAKKARLRTALLTAGEPNNSRGRSH